MPDIHTYIFVYSQKADAQHQINGGTGRPYHTAPISRIVHDIILCRDERCTRREAPVMWEAHKGRHNEGLKLQTSTRPGQSNILQMEGENKSSGGREMYRVSSDPKLNKKWIHQTREALEPGRQTHFLRGPHQHHGCPLKGPVVTG